ncbi:MAG: hypothetical protein IT320_19575 [Anaerolineae bacterium]|nr:hypothetical protein [Anaerolineae bacterium]
MRFAWLRKQTANASPIKAGCGIQLVRQIFNAAWWVPIVLALTGTVDYGTGFIAFGLATVARFSANLYMNNVLSFEQAEVFPFRS